MQDEKLLKDYGMINTTLILTSDSLSISLYLSVSVSLSLTVSVSLFVFTWRPVVDGSFIFLVC